MLLDIGSSGTVQGELDLFADMEERTDLMSAIDNINLKFGREPSASHRRELARRNGNGRCVRNYGLPATQPV